MVERGVPDRSRVHPAEPPSGGCIRGAAFREFTVWYEQKIGPEAFGARMAKMPRWMKQDLDIALPALGISDDKWYPDVTVHRLFDLLLEGLTPGQRHTLALQGATHVIGLTLRGVVGKAFGWIVTPERFQAMGHRLWSAYFDCGEFVIEPTPDGPGSIVSIRNWGTHHAFMCDLNRGASVALYRAMSCTDVSCTRQACVAEGASECRIVTRWSA
jgi:hypothetical protein